MTSIKVLPEHVANRIAAGEVIERPSSIIKELIENSIDAGADSIEVSIRHGGKSLIRIADNGSGIRADEVALAFQRHATSKIEKAEDLGQIASFGFRGEALPSIAAVSRTRLVTRAKGSPTGTEILIEGGRTVHVKECSCREGTIIEVRDLFFNTPARRKFMRTDATETGHVNDMVSNLALSHPSVHFKLISSDRTVFDLAAGEPLQKRAGTILGDKTAGQLIAVHHESEEMKIDGFIGKPSVARSNRMGQVLFVNGRWVKAQAFSYAIQEGFRGFLMHGQFPVSILSIKINPARVDVNVHPTKQEVRISNDAQVKSIVRKVIASALSENGDLAPQVKIPAFNQNPFDARESSPQEKQAFTPSFESLTSAPSTDQHDLVESAMVFERSVVLDEPIRVKDQLKIRKILGQVHGTFIIAETEEGLILIDQHAAHEKIQYEALMRSFESGQKFSQKLLMDEILEVSPKHARILSENLKFLEKLGFEIDDFGKDSFVIRSVPAVFDKESPRKVIEKYIQEKEEGALGTSIENQNSEVAALLACKTKSVKAHDTLSIEAMKSLVEQLSRCKQPFSCPHGRPSILKQSFDDLEKLFKRKL